MTCYSDIHGLIATLVIQFSGICPYATVFVWKTLQYWSDHFALRAFFRSHWLKCSKYTNIKCYEHLLPNCLAFLTHCQVCTFGEYDYRTPLKKHQLSNCCRMAEQHHQRMTKRSSNILAMTTHCMASFCPKIATSGWRRLKNLRPHGNVAKHQRKQSARNHH